MNCATVNATMPRARAEQHEEEDEQLLERPHHRLAAAAVARIEHRDRAERRSARRASAIVEAARLAGELGGVERDQRCRSARSISARVYQGSFGAPIGPPPTASSSPVVVE